MIGGESLAAGGYWALHGSSGPSHHASPDGRTLRQGNGAEPETLDNSLSTGQQDDVIIGDLMIGLMTEDVAGRPIPGMATEWKNSPDGLTWNFKLREAQ